MVGSGLFTLLKVECDKIRAAPCEGCLLTLVEGIKPFVVRLGVKKLTLLLNECREFCLDSVAFSGLRCRVWSRFLNSSQWGSGMGVLS
ncbi:hypothetical protein Bca101_088085 [Brassica carinata]